MCEQTYPGFHGKCKLREASALGADECVRPYTSLLNQRAAIAVWLFFWRDYYGCCDFVAWLQIKEADALGVAARFADRRRVHADDFAVVADQHDFGLVVDLRDADDFADALGGLQVD